MLLIEVNKNIHRMDMDMDLNNLLQISNHDNLILVYIIKQPNHMFLVNIRNQLYY